MLALCHLCKASIHCIVHVCLLQAYEEEVAKAEERKSDSDDEDSEEEDEEADKDTSAEAADAGGDGKGQAADVLCLRPNYTGTISAPGRDADVVH